MSLTSKGAGAVSEQSRAAEDAVAWTPNTDYGNEATWPPREHPLHSAFHEARLMHPSPWARSNYENFVLSLSALTSPAAVPESVRGCFEQIVSQAFRDYDSTSQGCAIDDPQNTYARGLRNIIVERFAALATLPSDPASVSGQPAPVVPDEVRTAFEGVDTGPLDYRPQELDDWGVIRQVREVEGGWRPVVASVRVRDGEDEQNAARREERDPRLTGVTGQAIVAAFNWVLDLLAATPSRRADTPLGSGDDGIHRCSICDQPLIAGQPVLTDVELGTVHAACCGPERESYVKDIDTGEPLAPDDPIPSGRPYEQDTPLGGGGAVVGDAQRWRLQELFERCVIEASRKPERPVAEMCQWYVGQALGLVAAPAAPEPAAGGEREIVRHKKRGTEYEVLHQGVELQVAVDRLSPGGHFWAKHLVEGERLIVYRGADGKLWAREEGEFRDGRFETILTPSEAGAAGEGLSQAARDVLAERRRQVEVEGWTAEHDDRHGRCEMAIAAACYAVAPSPVSIEREWVYPNVPENWPWHFSWWKPAFYRRNLIKAGALILAEIERWDRLLKAAPGNAGDDGGRA